MAWTATFDYTPGQVLTAANLDTYLSGNMNETAPGKVTTAGDIVYATGANAISRLGIGAAGRLLKVNSGATAPEWDTISNILGAQAQFVAAQVTSTNTSYETRTGGPAVTATAPPSGNFLVWIGMQIYNNTGGNFALVTVSDGTSDQDGKVLLVKGDGTVNNYDVHTAVGMLTGYTPGDSITITAKYKVDGGTLTAKNRSLVVLPV